MRTEKNTPIYLHLDMELPNDILQLNDVFKTNGYELYVVGGAVRDTILGDEIKDYDLATNASPDDVERILKSRFNTLPTGKHFGVINVFVGENEYEIATFREDGEYTDGRRPNSVVFTTIEGDVKRRDLTINALFYNIETSQVVDLVGGIEDIKNNIIRTVGSAEERFKEDRLRILRAIRFATRLGYLLSPEIEEELFKDSSLKGVSKERIRDEFIKSLKSAQSCAWLLGLYRKFNLFGEVFGELDVKTDFIININYITLLAIILRFNNDVVLKKTLHNLNYTSKEIETILFLHKLKYLNPENAPILKKLQNIHKIPDKQIRDYCSMVCRDGRHLIETFLKYELTINGLDVIKEYGLNGKELGDKIKELEANKFKKLLD